ncbi:Pkinase-domain-containing protein, partial [Basidiobolus meristosporus CBS 931.73]
TRGTDHLVAIKMIEKASGMHGRRLRALVNQEIEFLTMVDHPNIVAYYETLHTESHVCLVLEYVNGAELYEYVANDNSLLSDERRIQEVFSQLVCAVEHLHDRNICHRDIKLENVLIQNSDVGNFTVKLSDLGLAEYASNISYLSSRCGTDEYCAPEILLGQSNDGIKADIWSLGVILYTMIAKHLPFNLEPNESRRSFYARVNRAEYEFPSSATEGARDLISKVLQSNPSKRASINDIKQHPWLQHFF